MFERCLAYCKPVCSIGLSSNGLSLYLNATPANLGYSKFAERSWFLTLNMKMYYFYTCMCHQYKEIWVQHLVFVFFLEGGGGQKKNTDKGTKLLYVHFGVSYLCTIYVSIFIFLVKMWIFMKM